MNLSRANGLATVALLFAIVVGIVTIELYALSTGINGTGLSLSVGSLGSIAGYTLKLLLSRRSVSGRVDSTRESKNAL